MLEWTADNFPSRVAISTAFGPKWWVIIGIGQRRVTPRPPVFTIDVGFLFPETQELISKLEAEYETAVCDVQPEILKIAGVLPDEDTIEPDLSPPIRPSEVEECAFSGLRNGGLK